MMLLEDQLSSVENEECYAPEIVEQLVHQAERASATFFFLLHGTCERESLHPVCTLFKASMHVCEYK